MNYHNGNIRLRHFFRCLAKAAGITALAFALSFILMQPLSFSVMSVFSPPEKDDYTIADFYAQVADRRPVRSLDKDLVLVDIGNLDRQGIAGLLDALSLCDAKVIGLDIMFEGEQPGDSLLIAAITANPDIVMPVDLKEQAREKFTVSGKPFFYGSRDTELVSYGAANLPGNKKGATIREYRTSYPLADGESILSFPMAIAKKADIKTTDDVYKRGNVLETIDYPSREFKVIHADEVFDRAEELSGKIVLVGALTDALDMHSTPVNSYLSGAYIHAYALSSIIGRRFYSHNSPVADWILAAALCVFVTMTGLLVDSRIKGLVTRILQFILVYLAVQIGYLLYVDHHIIINFSYTLLMVTFGLFASDIWAGAVGLRTLVAERCKGREFRKIKPDNHD